MIRAFVAIELPTRLREELGAFRSDLKHDFSTLPLRWPPLRNIHLTLKFLGDVEEAHVDAIAEALGAQARLRSPFELHVGELGVFPNARRPRVLWVGVRVGDELMRLQRGIERECERLGFAPERRAFAPHLTLARVQRGARPKDLQRLAEWVGERKSAQVGTERINEVALFRSELKPSGAEYTKIATAKIGNPERESHAV